MSRGSHGKLPRAANLIATVFVTLALLLAALPQGAKAQSFQFTNVEIEGNIRVEDGTILTFAGISRGETLTAGQLNDAIQQIRASGLFESVEATPRGNTLVITVVEYPTISRINFEGNSRLSDSDLRPVVRSQERRVYSPLQAERDVAAITEAYSQQGRINATVTPKIIRRSDNRVDLVFEIFEGGVSEVQRISFVGNRSFSDNRLRRVLETKQAGLLRLIIQRDTFVADRIEFDKQVLTDFYRSRGYVDFTVQSVDVSLTRERDAYLITFNVQEGQQFRLGEVYVSSELDGVDPFVYERVIRARTGQVYSPVLLETDISRIEATAIRNGINFLQVEPRISRNDRDLTLDVEYALVRGPRVFIERIDIEGNNTTLDRVVRDQFRVVEGDPFNPRQIRQSAERIRALGYFSNANVNAREGSAPDQIVIDVDVEEAPTGSLSFGANFNSDAGLSLFANFRERNFLGRGQQLSFQLSTAETNRVFDFSFTEPRLLGRDVAFGIGLEYVVTNQENSEYDTESLEIRPALTFPISDNGRLQVFYRYDSTDLFDYNGSGEVVGAEVAEGLVRRNSLGYQYSFDSRRAGVNPTTAYVLRFGQEFGFGDSEFIKTTALAAAETKVLNEEVTLRATVEGGVIDFGDGAGRVTDRFFLNSRLMRGFEAGGVGPRECDAGCASVNDALGGNKYAVARLEAEFPLGLPEEYGISGGAFVDYGSVWDVGRTTSTNTLLYDEFTPRTVVGVSIFWDTPIGPLRFNWSEALDAQEFDEPNNFDVTISTSF